MNIVFAAYWFLNVAPWMPGESPPLCITHVSATRSPRQPVEERLIEEGRQQHTRRQQASEQVEASLLSRTPFKPTLSKRSELLAQKQVADGKAEVRPCQRRPDRPDAS